METALHCCGEPPSTTSVSFLDHLQPVLLEPPHLNTAVPTVQWSSASQASVAETGTLTVTAQLSATSTSAVTVPFTVTGTATSGTDYTITASPITIAAGSTTGTATITITRTPLSRPMKP